MSITPGPSLDLLEREETSQDFQPASPWKVLVWNDPVNLMSYVTYVFRRHFGFSQEKAHRLMLQVHEEGKALVFTGSQEEAERHTNALHAWGLWATFEREG